MWSYSLDVMKCLLILFLFKPQLPDFFGVDLFGGDLFGGDLFGGADKRKEERVQPALNVYDNYKIPEERAANRPHELGWLDLLKDEKKERMMLGKVPAGRIIPDEDDGE